MKTKELRNLFSQNLKTQHISKNKNLTFCFQNHLCWSHKCSKQESLISFESRKIERKEEEREVPITGMLELVGTLKTDYEINPQYYVPPAPLHFNNFCLSKTITIIW